MFCLDMAAEDSWFNGVTDSLIGPLVLLFVMLWLSGLYCTRRYWKDFREDEIRRGGSAETASEKWHELHPPPG